MPDDQVPIVRGASGLTGRLPIVREVDPEELDENGLPPHGQRAAGQAVPPACLRVLSLPEGRADCHFDCPGQQRDGSCLAALIRLANAHRVNWRLEVVREGERVWWDYVGRRILEA